MKLMSLVLFLGAAHWRCHGLQLHWKSSPLQRSADPSRKIRRRSALLAGTMGAALPSYAIDVVVVGSANTDLTTYVARMPRPGETVQGQRFCMNFGGKGANQAVAARLVGAEVAFVAKLGSDSFGDTYLSHLQRLDVDTSCVLRTDEASTGTAPILVDESGENCVVVVPGANALLSAADIADSRRGSAGCYIGGAATCAPEGTGDDPQSGAGDAGDAATHRGAHALLQHRVSQRDGAGAAHGPAGGHHGRGGGGGGQAGGHGLQHGARDAGQSRRLRDVQEPRDKAAGDRAQSRQRGEYRGSWGRLLRCAGGAPQPGELRQGGRSGRASAGRAGGLHRESLLLRQPVGAGGRRAGELHGRGEAAKGVCTASSGKTADGPVEQCLHSLLYYMFTRLVTTHLAHRLSVPLFCFLCSSASLTLLLDVDAGKAAALWRSTAT
eukprot:scaffold2069_cov254-Pinguiococcus_pyrenoidosus.AAC.9